MNSLPFQSATELAMAIRERKISAVDLLELYIERYERLNPGINAIRNPDRNWPGLFCVWQP